MPDTVPCKSCGKPMVWYDTRSGNVMPLDPEPAEDGNIVIINGVAHTLRGDLFEEKHDGPRYKSHFATCEFAAKHRKKK